MAQRDRKIKGFTLIEIILVITIIAIIVGAGIAFLDDSSTNFSLDSAARRIASDINYARSYALKTGKIVNVVFDSANNRYSLEQEGAYIKHPLRKDDFLITFTDKFNLEDVDLYQVVINGGGNSLNFNPDGTVNGGIIEIRYGGKKKVIIIDVSTGNIKIQ
ncbi:MAG: prepilin-type N-terminal cleavage/methylation domain-containing protein [Candidatus Schekmanbacteria bacterium]|nr:MAG: prepilin-type N-terminal cleavage/methylation domain-containing protein [Candidatus Schekmanbacteria bacterium]